MSASAGDKVLDKQVKDAITATSETVPVGDGVCKHHDGLRLGVNTLLLCQKADLDDKKKNRGFYFGSIGPFDRRDGYRICLVGLIAYAILVAYGKAPLPGPDVFEKLSPEVARIE